MKDKVLLEDVQKFWIATKQWDSGYQDLLDIMNVPSLADRSLQLKLSLLYKIIHGMSATCPQIFFVPVLIIVTELITPCN